jgi:hypothetical protein
VEVSVVQRPGFLLETVHQQDVAAALAAWVAKKGPRLVALHPGLAASGAPTDKRWQVRVNTEVESDL